MKERPAIWVWIETVGGEPKSAGLELLRPARELCGASGAELAAIVLGNGTETAEKAAAEYGADTVITAGGDGLERYNVETYTSAVCVLAQKHRPGAILFGGTGAGRELAPRVACRLETGLTADCTSLEMDAATGNIQWVRPAFGGNLMAVIECPSARPQIGTIRPGVYRKPERRPNQKARIIRETLSGLPKPRAGLIEVLAAPGGGSHSGLEEAEIIIAGGRGLGKAENFSLLRELAGAFGTGASVAASRAAVDEGWAPQTIQIGQTGKTVCPRLYIACGISGAAQHLVGIAGAKTMVAINKDPAAPIFGMADYGVEGDLAEVIPALAGEIRKAKAQIFL